MFLLCWLGGIYGGQHWPSPFFAVISLHSRVQELRELRALACIVVDWSLEVQAIDGATDVLAGSLSAECEGPYRCYAMLCTITLRAVFE